METDANTILITVPYNRVNLDRIQGQIYGYETYLNSKRAENESESTVNIVQSKGYHETCIDLKIELDISYDAPVDEIHNEGMQYQLEMWNNNQWTMIESTTSDSKIYAHSLNFRYMHPCKTYIFRWKYCYKFQGVLYEKYSSSHAIRQKHGNLTRDKEHDALLVAGYVHESNMAIPECIIDMITQWMTFEYIHWATDKAWRQVTRLIDEFFNEIDPSRTNLLWFLREAQ